MKIVISYTVLVALAIAQALPIDNGHVNPGLDATPKYSPLIDGDSAAVNISFSGGARKDAIGCWEPSPASGGTGHGHMVVAPKEVKDINNNPALPLDTRGSRIGDNAPGVAVAKRC
ncbi:hypothetical protein B0H11DRAFT_2220038 [Mycena galericulata]|nr:hypothetical protein B0H11DRAFT_2220038 [Mycena galericulata]